MQASILGYMFYSGYFCGCCRITRTKSSTKCLKIMYSVGSYSEMEQTKGHNFRAEEEEECHCYTSKG
jgi:hypothetical protein